MLGRNSTTLPSITPSIDHYNHVLDSTFEDEAGSKTRRATGPHPVSLVDVSKGVNGMSGKLDVNNDFPFRERITRSASSGVRIPAIEAKEKQRNLEKEKQSALEKEKQRALEKKKQRALEKEKQRALRTLKQIAEEARVFVTLSSWSTLLNHGPHACVAPGYTPAPPIEPRISSEISQGEQQQPIPGVLSGRQKEQQRRRQHIYTCRILAEEAISYGKQYTAYECMWRATNAPTSVVSIC